MKKALMLTAAVALVAAVFGLNGIRQGEPGKPLLHVAQADALVVAVATPQRQTILRTVQAPGQIEAVLQVEIRSEIPAKIEETPVEEGDLVKAGDLLCRLNDDEYGAVVESGEAVVGQLRASIRQVEADLAKAQRDCARQERLAQMSATSDIEMADHRTRLLKAQAGVEERKQQLAEAQAMLRRARENLKKTVITSPIEGVVAKIHAKPGEIVVTGTMNNPGTVVMVVTDLSHMQVRARVDETDVPLVKPGQEVDIFLPSEPQKAIPGRVLRVATSGTKQQGRDVVTFETLVAVESDDPSIKPAMTANVEIQVARKDDALTVPVQAVVHRKRKDLPQALLESFDARQAELGLVEAAGKAQYIKVVFCKDEDQAKPHIVRTGIADERNVELVEGISAQDVVITGPYRSLDQLKAGTQVKFDEDKKDDTDSGDDPQTEPAADTQLATEADTDSETAEQSAALSDGHEVAAAQ